MKKGFTLVELLAVIAVLGIISSIAVVSYSKVIKDNKVRECKRKVAYIEQKAIEYANENPKAFYDISPTSGSNSEETTYDITFFYNPVIKSSNNDVMSICNLIAQKSAYTWDTKSQIHKCECEEFKNPITNEYLRIRIVLSINKITGARSAKAYNAVGGDVC